MNNTDNLPHGLDPKGLQRARLARDPRFDGAFFLGVKTTGIYCRPICPARPAAEKNVQYFNLASQAAAAGFRPCLRCRPECAPGSPAWQGTSTTVKRALDLIDSGALNTASVPQLAGRLGVGERYLRKLFQQELGVSPQAVALNRRLLFAKKLLAETDMPLTQVAFAAGFGSVRRFNSAVLEHFRLTPGQMRGRPLPASGGGIRLLLHYRPPYDWDGVVAFLAHHAVSGIEKVTPERYRRTISCNGEPGTVEVSPCPGQNALQLTLNTADPGQLMPAVARVRRMFDLDANPTQINRHLQTDSILGALAAVSPGARSPGHWSLYEAAVRAIVGQQVSTVAARTVLSRLANACSDAQSPVFPSAEGIAALPDDAFPMPTRRRDTLRTVCAAYSGREQELDLQELAGFKGIGPWTVAMAAIRGAGSPDTFPAGDLGLQKAWLRHGGSKEQLQVTSEQWRPWRSYAANLLWRSL
ncbi:AlkA N-terminal domain-containing protein [Pseudohalioglobus sediminis]|nr:AlkA N-terminal domain-containing protein [Pseudohalioglobus sediminis]